MANGVPLVSIVCPAFEEEEVLPLFHRELAAVLGALQGRFEAEILYVDDGSRDRTREVMRGLAAADSRVRFLSLSRNFGKEAAMTAGLEHARGDAVIVIDTDLQHPPALIPALLDHWQAGAEVVVTLRRDAADMGPVKRLASRVFYRLLGWLSDLEVRVGAPDYRLLSRRAVGGLLRMRETHRFLRSQVQWLGLPTAEVGFQADVRRAGTTKYNLRRLLNLAADAVVSSSTAPLRLATLAGGVLLAGGLGYGAYAAARGLFFGGGFDFGRAWLLASLYFVGGCVLCGLGLVGEYVGRIYEQVKGRPLYVLKEASPEAEAVRRPADLGKAA
jgi:glycosyltransferase involved in cell wall biosynthesis